MTLEMTHWTKEALIARIELLEDALKEKLSTQNESVMAQIPWAGNLGQWYWLYDKNEVHFNAKKTLHIGYDPNTIGQVGFEFFTSKLHPDDYERVMQNMRDHLSGKRDAYEVEYRIQHKEGHYVWYHDRGVVTLRDEQGKPLLLQGIVFDLTEQKKVEERLRFLSERDDLTNLYNRRMLFTMLERLIKEHRSKRDTFSLIMFDIDHFKTINDTYGHLEGDKVLQTLAAHVQDDKRVNDLLYRYGGEEFVILLPNTALDGGSAVASRLHKQVQALNHNLDKPVTVSMSVVEHKLKESLDSLISRADALMYDAKKNGRNQIKS